MGNVFRSVLKLYNLAPGDFPDLANFQSIAREQDFTKFNALRQPMIDSLELVLSQDIPRLMDALPRALDPDRNTTVVLTPQAIPPVNLPPAPPLVSSQSNRNVGTKTPSAPVEEEYFTSTKIEANPFDDPEVEVWGLQEYIPMYQSQFDSLQQNGFVTGAAARDVLFGSGLQKAVLKGVWDLADYGKDGKLDLYEFVIVMFLVDMVKAGHELPPRLDPVMIPPSATK